MSKFHEHAVTAVSDGEGLPVRAEHVKIVRRFRDAVEAGTVVKDGREWEVNRVLSVSHFGPGDTRLFCYRSSRSKDAPALTQLIHLTPDEAMSLAVALVMSTASEEPKP